MNAIQKRRDEIRIAENKAPAEIKEVFTRLYQIIHPNGQYSSCVDILNGHDELRSNKEFAIHLIGIYPEAFDYFSDEIRGDREVLIALASSHVFYNDQAQGKNGSFAISPLSEIVFEHLRRIMSPNSKKYDVDEAERGKSGKGFSFVEEKNFRDYRINDPELVLNGLKAELYSIEYIKEMEKKYGQNLPYKGLELLEKLIQFKNVVLNEEGISIFDENINPVLFLEYNCLLSLRYASDELLKNKEFRSKVKEIMLQWVQFKEEENQQLEFKLSSGLDDYLR